MGNSIYVLGAELKEDKYDFSLKDEEKRDEECEERAEGDEDSITYQIEQQYLYLCNFNHNFSSMGQYYKSSLNSVQFRMIPVSYKGQPCKRSSTTRDD